MKNNSMLFLFVFIFDKWTWTLKHKHSLSNIMTTIPVFQTFISDFLAIFHFCIIRCILWDINKAIKDHNNSEGHSFFNTYFPDFLAIFLDFLKHFLWWDLNPNPETWTQPLRTMNTLPHSFFLIFWKQEKSHFKIYVYLLVCIENQCYCQVVIQTYPFASTQSLQAVWWGSWWDRCLRFTGTIIYFYCLWYQAEEGKKF